MDGGTERRESLSAPALDDSPFAVLRNRDFRLYWSGQLISLVGSWMQTVALSFVVVHITNQNSSLGLVHVAASVPMLLLSLSGGAIADRGDRRRILIITQVAMMMTAFGFAALVHWGHPGLGQIMAFAGVLGIAAAFDLPAAQALTPSLVPAMQIPQAVALMQAIFHGSRLIGPALAGLVIDPFGPEAAFVLNGVSFIAVIATLMMIRPAARPARKHGSGGIREGLTYLWSRADARALLAITSLSALCIFPFFVVYAAGFVKAYYGGSARALGILASSSGLGALAGALALLRVPADKRASRIALCSIGMSLALLAYSLSRHLALTAISVAILTFCVATTMGLVTTILQATVPDELRGRVMSVNTLAFTGLMPLAALLIGAGADATNLPLMMQGAAAIHLTGSVVVLSRRALHRVD